MPHATALDPEAAASPATAGVAAGVASDVRAVVDEWAANYLNAAELERRLVDAALRCVGRWGLRKTSLDDIAREAGVSRATAYRVFPGGKDRLVEVVFSHEAGRFFHEVDAELRAATSLEDLLVVGVGTMLRAAVDNGVLTALVRHEPDLILPHFAFHQLDGVLDLAEALARPHLERFLPAAEVRPAAELLARVVLTFGFRPTTWLDPHDPASVRRLVRTYLVPALTSHTPTSSQENP